MHSIFVWQMKLDIPICLIDESVVDYGFRVLMSGYVGEPFAKNPVLLLQHGRMGDGINGTTSLQLMPLGKWNDVRVEGNKLVAFPEFDDEDEDAVKVQRKVQKGYYNAASIWIDPIEVSDDESLLLPGQYGPTITKWSLREASIVDIPNCRNAVAIRNSAGAKILLSGNNTDDAKNINEFLKTFLPNNNSNMDKKILAVKLGLTENADDNAISEKLAALINGGSQLTALTSERDNLKLSVAEKDKEIGNLKTAAETEKINRLVQDAIDAKKILEGDKDKYTKLAAADFNTVKELFDSIKPIASIESQLNTGAAGEGNPELQALLKLSGYDLYMSGQFEKLKELSLPNFKLKYKEYYGNEYEGK